MKKQLIDRTVKYVRQALEGEGSGHDWWHIWRVWQNAKMIGKNEQVDMLVVELAALLHDIADYKFHGGDDTVGPRKAGEWLEKLAVDEETIKKVKEIIEDISFKGAKVKTKVRSKEGEVVQDADRLDAMGAIGIARCFAYGGHDNREIYNPDIKPKMHKKAEAYKTNKGTSVNHFYEKLLLLKDLMNTDIAKRIAEERHKFMEIYLERFHQEWKEQV